MSQMFGEQSWPQIRKHLEQRSLLILPVGTTEEHGPHLPVDTDARIAEEYGRRLAQALAPDVPVLLMDTIRYGYSMKIMRRWPGTIVIRSRVFMDYGVRRMQVSAGHGVRQARDPGLPRPPRWPAEHGC